MLGRAGLERREPHNVQITTKQSFLTRNTLNRFSVACLKHTTLRCKHRMLDFGATLKLKHKGDNLNLMPKVVTDQLVEVVPARFWKWDQWGEGAVRYFDMRLGVVLMRNNLSSLREVQGTKITKDNTQQKTILTW
jgi:hypothetical protein